MPLKRLITVALVLAGAVTALAAWGFAPTTAPRAHTTKAAVAVSVPRTPRPVPAHAVPEGGSGPVHAVRVRVGRVGNATQAHRSAARRALADLRELDRILRREHLRAGSAASALRELTRYVTLPLPVKKPISQSPTAGSPSKGGAAAAHRRSRIPNAVTAPAGTSRAATAIRYALAQLGKPYVWGAAGPRAFDCSGLVMRAWGAAGVKLPHFTGAIWQTGRHISRSQLRPGDLVYPYGLGHVQLYIGHGKVIEAPHTGADVRIRPLTSHAYGYLRVG